MLPCEIGPSACLMCTPASCCAARALQSRDLKAFRCSTIDLCRLFVCTSEALLQAASRTGVHAVSSQVCALWSSFMMGFVLPVFIPVERNSVRMVGTCSIRSGWLTSQTCNLIENPNTVAKPERTCEDPSRRSSLESRVESMSAVGPAGSTCQ